MSFLLEPPAAVEGIGPARTTTLEQAGITTIADMFAARAPGIRQLLPSTAPSRVGEWFCAAMLLRVTGMTADLAEALVEAGIRSVPKLAEAGLQTVERAVKRAHEANRIAHVPSLYKLAELQREAWRVRDRGMLAGRVLDADGEPVPGAVVEAGHYDFTTDDAGRYAFHALRQGPVDIGVRLPNLPRPLVSCKTVAPGKLIGPLTHRLRSAPGNAFETEPMDELDGALFVHTSGYRNRLKTLPLASFRDGTHFLVREVESDGGARLLNLYKKRSGTDTIIERTNVEAGVVPAGAAIGRILKLAGGALQLTDLTSADVAELKRQRWAARHPTSSSILLTSAESADD